ncbi:MAG: hypothetical protein AB1791_13580 [Chloroflexota bacterium]
MILQSVEGIFLNGNVKLAEMPHNIREGTLVIVTFLAPGLVSLGDRGIDEAQAADLRARLTTFADDWDNPEMGVYDNYDAAKASL